MVEDQGETAGEPVRTGIPEDYAAKARAEAEAQGGAHRFIEVWNDYDPSMRFIVIFPVGVEHGVTASSVAYYVFEPGRHSGLHHDNAEEIAFVAEGEGEVFTLGTTTKLVAGTFVVFPAGADHDIYAQGGVPLRLLSFFPTAEILSTFQQPVYPVGGNVLSSAPPPPIVTELDPDNLPDDFPFSLEELGLAGETEPREPTMTERLIGMAAPGETPSAEPDAAGAEAASDASSTDSGG